MICPMSLPHPSMPSPLQGLRLAWSRVRFPLLVTQQGGDRACAPITSPAPAPGPMLTSPTHFSNPCDKDFHLT